MMRPLFGEVMPTGVEEVKPMESNSFVLYPNPLNGNILHLDWYDKEAKNVEVEIYNITGQLILRRNFDSEINVADIGNGVYLVRLTDKSTGEQMTQKLIKRNL